jgi:hypothetical protein
VNLRRDSAGGSDGRGNRGGHLSRCVRNLNGDLVDDDDGVDRNPEVDDHGGLANNLNGLNRDDRGTLVHGALEELRHHLRVRLSQGAAGQQASGSQQAPSTYEVHNGQVKERQRVRRKIVKLLKDNINKVSEEKVIK